jgi:hypothetical protein
MEGIFNMNIYSEKEDRKEFIENFENSMIELISEIQIKIDKTNKIIFSEVEKKNYENSQKLVNQKKLCEEALSVFEKSLQPLLLILKKEDKI